MSKSDIFATISRLIKTIIMLARCTTLCKVVCVRARACVCVCVRAYMCEYACLCGVNKCACACKCVCENNFFLCVHKGVHVHTRTLQSH